VHYNILKPADAKLSSHEPQFDKVRKGLAVPLAKVLVKAECILLIPVYVVQKRLEGMVVVDAFDAIEIIGIGVGNPQLLRLCLSLAHGKPNCEVLFNVGC
jgi:hypothetical protein